MLFGTVPDTSVKDTVRGITLRLVIVYEVRSFRKGPIMAKRYYGDTMYDGMIKQNNTEFANMPTGVKFAAYPKGYGYTPENLNDGISGIDKQMMKDTSKRSSGAQPDKY